MVGPRVHAPLVGLVQHGLMIHTLRYGCRGTSVHQQIAAAVEDEIDFLSGKDVKDTFAEAFVPIIQKYQLPHECSPLGEYLVTFARLSNCSKVSFSTNANKTSLMSKLHRPITILSGDGHDLKLHWAV